jgi:hypothetical protein
MRIAVILFLLFLVSANATAAIPARVDVRVDTGEAEAVLEILNKLATGREVSEPDWQSVFASEGYVRLKKRELAMNRPFTEEDFRQFVLSPELYARRERLAATLASWRSVDVENIAARPLAYLPPEATIRATIFPVIKPRDNSFVFDVPENPAIFMYLDPDKSKAIFENELAHELHHIGFGTLNKLENADLSPQMKRVSTWLGAFGEGFAMLAAAGGPDVHPHAESKTEDRTRWDADLRNFNEDLRNVEAFFLDLGAGNLDEKQEIERARSFYGIQGPWYTVGWKMAVVIEKMEGRKALIKAMTDARTLPGAYNRAARKYNARKGENLATWSNEFLAKLN